jgi:probable F420-dependent oxidoreductase
VRVGATFPQTELEADHRAVRAFAAAIADLGFDHVAAYDHVLGADPALHPEGPAPGAAGARSGVWHYTHEDPFQEPLVLFGFLAALTDVELVTGILILPQRQTVLVAKQVATLDVLCAGKLRLGVGIGWNAVEYEALEQSFEGRGRRIEEQVALLRRLWTEPVLTFEGNEHTVRGAGLVPLPVQRPVPVWMGSQATGPGLRRVGRLADGWISLVPPGDTFDRAWAEVRSVATECGRNPDDIGLEGRIDFGDGDVERVASEAAGWRTRGATHVTVNTLKAGLAGVDAHVRALEIMREAIRR